MPRHFPLLQVDAFASPELKKEIEKVKKDWALTKQELGKLIYLSSVEFSLPSTKFQFDLYVPLVFPAIVELKTVTRL